MTTNVNQNLDCSRSVKAMRNSEQAGMDTSQVEENEVNF